MHLPTAFLHLMEKLEGWGHSLFLLLPNIVLAILMVLLFWLLARVLDRGLRRLMKRLSVGHEIIDLTAVLVFVIITALGVFIALDVLGLDKAVTSLLAGVGILALAIGLAFQSTGENYVAGIYLSVKRPFRVGHIIGSSDYFGVVERMTLRSTLLRVPEGQLVYLPNKKIFENAIVNYSDNGLRMVALKVGVTYGEDLEQVKRVATEAVAAVKNRARNQPVEFFYDGFGDSSINFEVRFWIPFDRQQSYLSARSDAVVCIKRAFDEHDITIPFPIRTLDFARVGGETLEEQLRAVGLARDSGKSERSPSA